MSGAVAVAAPIFGTHDQVIGDSILTIPEPRFDPALEGHLADRVMRCSNAITAELGGTAKLAV